MKGRIVWLVVSGVVALSLVMASCAKGPATPTGPAPTTAVPTAAAPTRPTPGAPTAPAAEKPKYGGKLTLGLATEPNQFDPVRGNPFGTQPFHIVNEELWRGDWAKGPAGGYGTNEASWTINNDLWRVKAGYLAESWKMDIGAETASITWSIRRGVRFALNPDSEASRLVNGREMTADDVIFSTKTVLSDTRTYLYQSERELREALAKGNLKVTSPGPWQVKWEIPRDLFYQLMYRVGDYHYVVPKEVWERPGNMNDWKTSVGTGPWMLTEVLPGTSQTFKKNPNYWMKDPVGPGKGNQLPYIDEVKWLIIPDRSTLMAAFRTAKIDHLPNVYWEDARNLIKEKLPVKWSTGYSAAPSNMVGIRTDKPPFNDIRVRQALMLAIDFEGIKKNYMGGEAQILTWPYPYFAEYGDALLTLDEAPESVKELYSYKPDKAKKLLAEAGYPQGFKTTLVLLSLPEHIDYYSIYKDMWSKIGIDVTLQALERGAHTTAVRARNYEGMLMHGGQPGPVGLYSMLSFRGPGENNASYVNDPKVEDAFIKMQSLVLTDIDAAHRLNKDLMKYVLEQVWRIPRVTAPEYFMWWPWLKGYSGEDSVGHANRIWAQYVWIDQDLKKSMGY
ncbi:MAG: hypothetical protein HYX81_02315 [Chloroflexi bacterium]|nr:hypothetical protein [Chloroflexota bacterium]